MRQMTHEPSLTSTVARSAARQHAFRIMMLHGKHEMPYSNGLGIDFHNPLLLFADVLSDTTVGKAFIMI
jgi:hypothetical protein